MFAMDVELIYGENTFGAGIGGGSWPSSPPIVGEPIWGVGNITVSGNQLFFTAAAEGSGGELWVSDGTSAGTRLVKDINTRTPSMTGGSSSAQYLKAFGNNLVFSADDGINGRELWISDGTSVGTLMLEIATGSRTLAGTTTPNSSDPRHLTAVGGKVVFSVDHDGDGSQLNREFWETDGTIAGTRRIAGVSPISIDGAFGESWVVLNDAVYFWGLAGNKTVLLWQYVPSTGILRSLASTIGGRNVTVSDSSSGQQALLWLKGGTVQTIQRVSVAAEDFGSSSLVYQYPDWFSAPTPSFYTFPNGAIFQGAESDGSGGYLATLCVTDGTQAGTKTLLRSAKHGESFQAVAFDNESGSVLFYGYEPGNPSYTQRRLLSIKVDGSEAAARPLLPEGVTYTSHGVGGIATLRDGTFVFSADLEIWNSNGRTQSLQPLFKSITPQGLTSFAGNVYFTTNGYSLWAIVEEDAARPDAPVGLVGFPTSKQVSLNWIAPASDGGSAITDYIIQFSLDNGSTWTTCNDSVSTTTTATVTGLTNGTSYVFRVAAKNSVGIGEYSVPSAPVIPRTVPVAPTAVLATASNREVALAWAAPASNGGAAITDYVIQYSVNSGSTWTTFNDGVSTLTSTIVTGLTNGTSYVFRVGASNVAGTGAFSSNSSAVVPREVLTEPLAVLGSAGNRQVSLTWAPPAFTGGSPVTDYVIQYRVSSGSTWTTFNDGVSPSLAATVTGLTNGTGYVFRVAAKNASGLGPYSLQSTVIVPRTVPASPRTIAATAANSRATLSWLVPASNGGAEITDYVIQFTTNDGLSWTAFNDGLSTSLTTTLTGLTNGLTYAFRVAAVNAAGIGEYSAVSPSVVPRAVVVEVLPAVVVEATGTAKVLAFPLKIRGDDFGPFTLTYATRDGTAAAVSDYRANRGTLQITPRQQDRQVLVSVPGDSTMEQDEFFWLDVSAGGNGAVWLANSSAPGWIIDDDSRFFTVARTAATVAPAGIASFTVGLGRVSGYGEALPTSIFTGIAAEAIASTVRFDAKFMAINQPAAGTSGRRRPAPNFESEAGTISLGYAAGQGGVLQRKASVTKAVAISSATQPRSLAFRLYDPINARLGTGVATMDVRAAGAGTARSR